MKKVGITSGFMYPGDGQKIYSKKSLCYVEKDFVNFVAQKGVLPVIIPDLDDDKLEEMLQQLDGIVLHGGSDVAPESYGETAIGEWKGDKYRDLFEFKVIEHAYKNNKPILGVCRGCQMLNVYFGGTLWQDIPSQIGNTVKHSDSELYDCNIHKLEIVGDNILSKHIDKEQSEIWVNSLHHQVVKTVGPNMEVLAISPDDGIIEAIQLNGMPAGKIIGVQWHPEFNYKMHNKLFSAEILFDLFRSHL